MDTVRSWMSSPAIVALETMLLPEARQLLYDRQIRRLPVVNVMGQLVGIVSRGDIHRVSDTPDTDVRDYDLRYRVSNLPLAEIMTREVITVTPDTPMIEVAQLLLEHKIGGTPVVADGQIVGMITESDLFRMIIMAEEDVSMRKVNKQNSILERLPRGFRERVRL